MVPPTGAADSILVVRRNGAAVDGHYGAPATKLKNYPMEGGSENKIKRQWGEKLRMGKSAKFPPEGHSVEQGNFMIHPDYLNKYGTLSNGVVTKSFKYAETWLYGTVGVRGGPTHRPSLFLYPGVVTPAPRIVPQNAQGGFSSPPAAFVPIVKYPPVASGTLRQHKVSEQRPSLGNCRCSDYRRDAKRITVPNCRTCGGKKNGTVRNSPSRTGAKLLEITTTHEAPSPPAVAQDPYNMMRKNRLSVADVNHSSTFHSENIRIRGKSKSLSPIRGISRDLASPSFETFKPKQNDEELECWKMDEEWSNMEDNEEERMKRKSILECDVNAYELNGKGSNGSDDSADELSDGTAEVNAKLKILRPKLAKTDLKSRKIKVPDSEGLANLSEKVPEIRTSGQRFRIFDHSYNSQRSMDGYASDDGADRGITSAGFAPRLPSPQRPPRKPKEKNFENSFRYSKSKSKSSPNLSIKSILKKPTGSDDSITSDSSSPNSPATEPSPTEKRREILLRSINGNGNSNQATLKKKKQVQFKVNVSNESLSDKPEEHKQPPEQDIVTKANGDMVQRSMSCEDLLLVNQVDVEDPFGGSKAEAEAEEIKSTESRGTMEDAPQVSENGDALLPASPLKRSFSDRRPAGAVTLLRDTSETQSKSQSKPYMFNDTMALRTRGSRADTREIFVGGDGHLHLEECGKENRPKEPPPAPPPSSNTRATRPTSNLITYAEFTRLTDQAKEISPDKSYLRRMRCKSLDHTVTPLTGGNPPPSPPPRQAHSKTRKISSPGATSIRLQVSSADKARNGVSIVGNLHTDDQERRSKPEVEAEFVNRKTVVTLSPSDEAPVLLQKEVKRPSVTIHPKNMAEDYSKDNFGKTSVMINNFHKGDSNKVTISVRNEMPMDEESNSSTCTIIETGSNSTVIPVMSTDNKTTLIVGNSSTAPVAESTEKPEKLSQYIFSDIKAIGEDHTKVAESMDPVEAVRRNLIPHICGKEETNQSLMERIKQSRESKEQKNLRQISQLFSKSEKEQQPRPPAESLLSTYQARRNLTSWKTTPNGTAFKIEEDDISLSDSFCSSVKNSSTNTSRSNSFRSNSYKSPESDYDSNPFVTLSMTENKYFVAPDSEDTMPQELDKLEDEYEIRSGLSQIKKEETENIYETIKEEPIYDQIRIKVENEESEEDDDVPPPLPLTLPPSLDEVESMSPKSIFEGATKYDILSYLVDAKDRVQEDTYFSGSSTSEEIDSRRLSLLEESERTSFDSGMHCRSPSDGLEGEENLTRLENCKKDTSLESDSGVDLSSRISHISATSDSSDDNLILSVVTERDSLKLNRKSSAEIERNDSGVGSETSQTSRSKWQASSSIREDPQHLCEDCDQPVETQVTDSGVMYAPLVCRKCSKRRSERKEIIQEIVETEEKYGRDLKIILEEFYRPMLVAGLLTPEQLSAIFLNVQELMENNEQLTEKLRDTLEIAVEQGDEDLLTVNIGKLFLEAGPMLHAFESYCTRQATAAVLLANLEKEKELLRIFLRVSQMENTVLRRMNLNSFLMVPVQRVTKYPLLLARLYKVTPPHHESRELLREAQHNIELHLEHMNSEAKDLSAIKVWRRFSASTASGRKSTAELEMINIKLRKMAIDVLEWNHEEVRFVMEGKLLYTQPTDNNWKRGRTIKLSPIFVLLVTLGKPNTKYKTEPGDEELTFPKKTGVREATLLLVKEKCGRYTLIREPLFLDKIIVCCETDSDEFFEIQELSTKDTVIFKAEDVERTKEWYRQLQYHAQILGSWRRRRNALANIMINGMMARTYTT